MKGYKMRAIADTEIDEKGRQRTWVLTCGHKQAVMHERVYGNRVVRYPYGGKCRCYECGKTV